MSKKILRAVASSLLLAMTACSIEIRDAREPVDAAHECMGDKGYCVVSDRGKIEHVKTVAAADEQVHAAILAHPEWVREAMLANPQMIAEVQAAAAQKQAAARQAVARQALVENRAAVFADPADPVIGNPAGDVTIVEVTDYQCPYCKGLTPVLDQLLAGDPGIRLVTKEFPILGLGSEVAARYALASMKQGKYAPFHAALMADRTPEHQLDETRIKAIAGQVGLDLGRLKTDADSPEIATRIAANRALAQKLTISGTPGLIIGDQVQGGAMTLEALKKAVADARAKKTALIAY